jgi:hypothetical protein
MGDMSGWHVAFAVLWVVLVAPPIAKILSRTGFGKWWTVVAFIAPLNLVALWVFAFCKWPAMASPEYAT